MGIIVAFIVGSACAGSSGAGYGAPDRPTVVASAYPLAWAAERIAGDRATVVNLTPPGVEPHDLEISSDDLAEIAKADIVVYLGSGFQPSVERAIETNAQGTAIDLLDGRELLVTPLGSSTTFVDPHVWLDPDRMREIAADIEAALAEADPDSAALYESNLAELDAKLAALDSEYESSLATCDSRAIVTSHAAFAYLTGAYALTQYPVVVAPDAEPNPGDMADLVELVDIEGVTTIFTETLASPRVADALASEAGVTTQVLDPLEGLTPEADQAGADYLSIMRDNLAKLRVALGCKALGSAA